MAISRIARLGIEIDTSQVPGAKKEVEGLGGAGGKAAKNFNLLKVAIGAVVSSLAVKEITQAADAYTNITNRLRQATTGAKELAQAQADVGRIAQASYSDIESVAALYGRLGRQADELGITQEQVARTTETITKAIALSGASAQEASGAVRQLAQGLAAGTLRGEEFNAVAENAPRLLEILKDEFGATTGELRKLAEEGELTSERIVAAFEAQSKAIDKELANIAPTISVGLQSIGNGFIELVGAIDSATGASAKLAEVFVDIGDNLSEAAGRTREYASEQGRLQRLNEELAPIEEERAQIIRGLFSSTRATDVAIYADQLSRLEPEYNRIKSSVDALNGSIKNTEDEEQVARLESIQSAYQDYYDARLEASKMALQAEAEAEASAVERTRQTRSFATQEQLNERRFALDGERQALQDFDDWYRDLLGSTLEYEKGVYQQKLDARQNTLQGERDALAEYDAEQREALQERIRLTGEAASAIGGFFVQIAKNSAAQKQRELRDTEGLTEDEIAARERSAKAAFETAQTLQKGLVVINTAAAVMSVLSDPTLIGFARWSNVAAVVATGATQLAAINGQSFRGGGGSVGSAPQAPETQSQAQGTTMNNQVTVNFTGSANRDDIANALRDVFNDDGILFDQNSAQAQVLVNG